MYSNLLLLIIFCCCNFVSFSQIKVTDSLIQCVQSTKSDTAKARLYNEIGMQYESTDSDSAIFFYNKTITIIEQNNTLKTSPIAKVLQAQATLNIGWVLCAYKSQYDSAIAVSERAIKLFLEFIKTTDKVLFVKVHKGIAACYTNIGGAFYFRGYYNNAIEYYKKSLEMYQPLHDSKDPFANLSGCLGLSNGYLNIGVLNYEQGNYPQALKYHQKALKINEELSLNPDKKAAENGKRSIANCYANIALVFSDQGESVKEIEYDQKALDIYIEMGDKNGIGSTYNNIGNYYNARGLLYRSKGNTFESNRNFSFAINYYQKSLIIKEKLGNKKGLCSCYNNIGNIFGQQKNYKEAIDYFQKAVKIAEELEDKNGLTISLGNIAGLNISLAESPSISPDAKTAYYSEALKFGQKAYDISKEINAIPYVNANAGSLLKVYKGMKNSVKALEFAEIFIATKDSMFQTEKTEAVIGMEKKYQAEKKQQEIEKQMLQLSKKDAEIKEQQAVSSRQKIIIIFVVCGLLFVIIVLFVIYNMFKQKKKSNEIITIKNNELEQANDEIRAQRDVVTQQKEQIEYIYEELTDSILYAERIQKAVLPSPEYIDSILNRKSDNNCMTMNDNCVTMNNNCMTKNVSEANYFILFKPRNIVSGDFYWLHKRSNWLLIAVADCTGHGVPGAFMSMLGVSLLNEIVGRSDITQADQVLNELREHIISSLQQRGLSDEQKDGMDIGFVALNTESLEMQFAGANNPVYIIKQFKNETTNSFPNFQIDSFPNLIEPVSELASREHVELVELKGDKQPIGIHSNMQPFTNQIYQLQKGDAIYLMSDGYEDQFGGPNRKKFLAKNLKNLLIAKSDAMSLPNCQQPMANQKQILETTITDWMKDQEQIDDITVLGIKI